MVGGLPLGLIRKNSLARVCSWLGDELLREFDRPSLSFSLYLLCRFLDTRCLYLSSLYLMIKMPLPWGWLVLFIGKGPGPLPKYLSGKGANNWPIRRGTSGTLILTKVGLRLPKALW